MRFDALDVIAPGVLDAPCNEAEAMGSAVWLYMHSASHRNMPLHLLSRLLLPAIKRRQFVLASQDGQPVFFLTWALFSPQTESRYIANPPQAMQEADWTSGDRMWVLDWVAPFGHTRVARQLLTRLFPTQNARALYHRGDTRGLRVLQLRGIAVMPEEAQAWAALNPIQPLASQGHGVAAGSSAAYTGVQR